MSPLKVIQRLHAYPLGELLWMAEAMFWITCARLLIRFVPFRRWRHWMGPIGAIPGHGAPDADQQALARRTRRCVKRMAVHAPLRANCLPQAMATRWMLARRGVATELHIGARTATRAAEGKPVDLHAWILCGPLCLAGGDQRRQFAALMGPPPDAREAG